MGSIRKRQRRKTREKEKEEEKEEIKTQFDKALMTKGLQLQAFFLQKARVISSSYYLLF